MVKRHPFDVWRETAGGKKKSPAELYPAYEKSIERRIRNKAAQVTKSYFLEELYRAWQAWEG